MKTADDMLRCLFLSKVDQSLEGAGGGELLSYIGMCSAKGYCLLAVLVWNRVRFLHSSLQFDMFLDEAASLSLGDKTISKCLRQPDEL